MWGGGGGGGNMNTRTGMHKIRAMNIVTTIVGGEDGFQQWLPVCW